MTTQSNDTESSTNSIPAPPTTTSESGYVENQSTETENKPDDKDSNLDEYGYEKTVEEKPADEVKPVEEKPKEEPVKPATGYGDEPAKEDKPADKVAAEGEKSAEVLKKEEVDVSLGELPEGYNKETVSKFVLDNNMTKEQVEAYVKFSKEESAQLKLDQDAHKTTTRSSWMNELKTDSNFGGEHFDKNVDKAEKIFDKYFGNMKKALTDKGTMLPPYIMKDFLALHHALNPKTELVVGGVKEVKKENTFLEEAYK